MNITKLAKLSGIRYSIVKKEVEELSNKGYVEIDVLGKVIVVRVNYTSEKIIILKNLLDLLDEI
ncbi:hypothetical protein HS7_19730 [Sulfolobales archaeon HS-7]|nr:hypothetical protein HS7_19730 [Sulfolobales archaeon HS-7]